MDYQSILDDLNESLNRQKRELEEKLKHMPAISQPVNRLDDSDDCKNLPDIEDVIDILPDPEEEPEIKDIPDTKDCSPALKLLQPLEGLEKVSVVKLKTFNSVYHQVFSSDSGVSLQQYSYTTNVPKLDYSELVMTLGTLIETECFFSIVKYHYGHIPSINERPKEKMTMGDMLELEIKRAKLPSDLFPNRSAFHNAIWQIKEKRNDAAHPDGNVFKFKDFQSFYSLFVDFYENYIPMMIILKNRHNQNPTAQDNFMRTQTDNHYSATHNFTYTDSIGDYKYPSLSIQESTMKRKAESSTSSEQQPVRIEKIKRTRPTDDKIPFGVILTDTRKITNKYFCEEVDCAGTDIRKEKVLPIFECYIDSYKKLGIMTYDILDLGDTTFGDGKRALDYKEIIAILDQYCEVNGINSQSPVPLFIVGGNDVIEMPCVVNPYVTFVSDVIKTQLSEADAKEYEGKHSLEKDVSTDFFYSFASEQIKFDNSIFFDWSKLNDGPRFFVSRLPMADGFMDQSFYHDFCEIRIPPNAETGDYSPQEIYDKYSYKELEEQNIKLGYFVRVMKMWSDSKRKGIEINQPCYLAMEKNKKVSRCATEYLPSSGLRDENGLIYQGIFLSPNIDLYNPEQKKNNNRYLEVRNKADLALYICHGSPNNTINNRGLCGEDRYSSSYPCALSIEIQKYFSPKVFVANSCWGARFIGYSRNHSLLLTSIYEGGSLIYVGSSRSSYGMMDYDKNGTPLEDDKIRTSAGIELTRLFLINLMNGIPVAQALTIAKYDLINSTIRNKLQLGKDFINSFYINMLSILQFNVFGDPMLYVHCIKQETDQSLFAQSRMSFCGPLPKMSYSLEYSKYLGDINNEKPTSLLDRLRGKVDQNFADIRKKITKSLYEQYGLNPDHLDIALKRGENAEDGYELVYQNPDNELDGSIAIVSKEGKLLNILYKI